MPNVGGVNGEHLKSFIERIERLDDEIRALNEDKKEVYAEAKGTGFDTKIMKQIIKIRRMDKDDLDEQETLLEIYKQALGMLPLFEAAEEPEEETGTPVATRAGARETVLPSLAKDARDSLAKAARDFVAPIAGHPGGSIEVTSGGAGIRIENRDGEMVVEEIPAKKVEAVIEEMPPGAILAAGASAAARGEPEDACPHAEQRKRELWLQGHREMAERKRRAA